MAFTTDRTLTVWFEGVVPYALIHDGRYYAVTDDPTRLEEELVGLTHLPAVSGWRFQATDQDNVSHMFVIARTSETWTIVKVYD